MYIRRVADVTIERDEWMRRLGPLYPGLIALSSLTALPLPSGLRPTDDDRARSAPWFPVVGMGTGLALAIVARLLLWGRLPPALIAFLVQIAAVGLVGMGPLVGLAWTARRLYQPSGKLAADLAYWLPGVLSVIGLLSLRIIALMAVSTEQWIFALVSAEVLAHAGLLLSQYVTEVDTSPDMDESSTPRVGRVSLTTLGMGSAITGAFTLSILIWSGAVALFATLLAMTLAFAISLALKRHFGRLPAPSLNAIVALCGVIVLISFAAAHPTSVSPWVR